MRSITCPEYILSEYYINNKSITIKNAHIYVYQNVVLLLIINS